MAINPIIVELLKWGISAGADMMKARAVLRANGVDPDEYKAVIDDKRTFRDFHGENPRNQPALPEPPPTPPAVDERYGRWSEDHGDEVLESGDNVYGRESDDQVYVVKGGPIRLGGGGAPKPENLLRVVS